MVYVVRNAKRGFIRENDTFTKIESRAVHYFDYVQAVNVAIRVGGKVTSCTCNGDGVTMNAVI